jgi:hypothetical protein
VQALACALWATCLVGSATGADRDEENGVGDRLRRLEREHEAQKEELRRQEAEIDRLREQIERRDANEAGAQDVNDAASDRNVFLAPGIWSPRGDTSVTQFDLPSHLSLGFGTQYRLLYNASNVPGPGGTTFSDTESYDFLSQRLRLNLAVAPKGVPVGGLLQAEFLGGFGGSSPAVSDPRNQEPTLNPFNRLEARGIRYGYLFAEPLASQRLVAGILPLSDEVGDTLFSADWDFNVGGVAYLGALGPSNYRLAYLELVEGVGASDDDTVREDGTLLIGDYVHQLETMRVGLHSYYMSIGEGLPLGDTQELWIGPSVEMHLSKLNVRAFGILNVGRLGQGTLDEDGQVASGFETNDGHTGLAVKIEASHPIGASEVSLQALYSTGDRENEVQDRFVTPQALVGTQGYWAYTHLFTANPPSDVNDLGLDLDNSGAGLLTVQGRVRIPLLEWLRAETTAGLFLGAEERNDSRELGVEVAGLLTFVAGKGFQIDVGSAGAFLGSFFGPGAEDLYEVFARIQYQF